MKALGLILAGGNNNRMRELSNKRAIAAMPVGGSFRCIDFALSNMSNSHIQTVAVLTQYNSRSLNEHLSSAKWWNFGRKQGGLYVFTPTVTSDNSWWYRGTADAISETLIFSKRRHEPYVIITSGDCVYKMDYNEVLDFHISKKADITVVCRDMGPEEDDVSRFGIVRMNEDSRIVEFEEKPMVARSPTPYLPAFMSSAEDIDRDVRKVCRKTRWDFVNDILIRYKNLKRIYGYKMTGYWNNIATVESYYKTNMDFLKKMCVTICSGVNQRFILRSMICRRQNIIPVPL